MYCKCTQDYIVLIATTLQAKFYTFGKIMLYNSGQELLKAHILFLKKYPFFFFHILKV